MELRNRRLSDDQFFHTRKEVLSMWPTGKEIDLDEAIGYRRRLPDNKVWAKTIGNKRRDGRPRLMLTMGHATVEETLDHMMFLDGLGADILTPFPDAYSRKARYDEAEKGLRASVSQKKSMLNGYPLVNHGLARTREIRDNINIPIRCIADCDEDPRLNAEMALASGFDNGSLGVHDLMQHSKNYPASRRIQNSQYCDRLAAYYSERGAPVELQVTGNLCGWDPPGIKIAMVVLQSLLAAEQGVRNMHPVLSGSGNLVQDTAALRLVPQLMKEYLHRFGYDDVREFIPVGYIGWQGPFPSDPYQASGLMGWCASIGALAGVDYMWARSIYEAVGIASKDSNAGGLKIFKQVINSVGEYRLPENDEVRLEKEMIRLEVAAIVDAVVDLGQGDVAVGQVKALESGVLDSAFSPWIHLKGKVLPVRDRLGAIRYLDHGNLPLPGEVVRYHKQKIAERESVEGRKADLKMVIRDITHLSRDLSRP